MPKFLSTADLDTDSLRANFIAYLKTQDRFKDFNFEGSNMAAMIDILMQNTAYNLHYWNMVGTEAFQDTAEIREAIVSRAKELNYVPRSRTSARSSVSIEIVPNDTPETITIPKGYQLSTNISTSALRFVTTQNYVLSPVNGIYRADNVEVFEGEVVTEVFDVISSKADGYTTYTSKFTLQSENIDVSSIEVYVQTDVSAPLEKYSKRDSLFGLSGIDNVYFIQGYRANQYEIVFGDGICGAALITGNIVTVRYRDTVGVDGNGVSIFRATNAIQGYSNITVTNGINSYGGGEREDNDSIKFNAPRHFQTQERAVVDDDFIFLIKNNFPEVESVCAYGGQLDKQYGKVIIALKPKGSSGIASSSLKNRIINFIKLKNLTTEPVIVDADYFNLNIISRVRYNVDLLTTNEDDLKTKVVNSLLTLNNTTLNDFGKNIYASNIGSLIDNTDRAVMSNTTEIRLIKRLSPTRDVDQSFTVNFGNELRGEGVRFVVPDGFERVIETSTFSYLYGNDEYDAYMADDGNGKINVYAKESNAVLTQIGTVNYDTGIVNFTIRIWDYENTFDIYARIESGDIIMDKNKFVIALSKDFDIKMVQNA